MHSLYEGYRPEDTGTSPGRILESILRPLLKVCDLSEELKRLEVHSRDSGYKANLEAMGRLLATAERMRKELHDAAVRVAQHV